MTKFEWTYSQLNRIWLENEGDTHDEQDRCVTKETGWPYTQVGKILGGIQGLHRFFVCIFFSQISSALACEEPLSLERTVAGELAIFNEIYLRASELYPDYMCIKTVDVLKYPKFVLDTDWIDT